MSKQLYLQSFIFKIQISSLDQKNFNPKIEGNGHLEILKNQVEEWQLINKLPSQAQVPLPAL